MMHRGSDLSVKIVYEYAIFVHLLMLLLMLPDYN